MAEDLKVGDVVRLKSGGPKMTIKGIGHYGMIETETLQALCVWFDEKNKPQEKAFDLNLLTKAEDPPASGPSRAIFKR